MPFKMKIKNCEESEAHYKETLKIFTIHDSMERSIVDVTRLRTATSAAVGAGVHMKLPFSMPLVNQPSGLRWFKGPLLTSHQDWIHTTSPSPTSSSGALIWRGI
jgi:hypothetical protein